MSLADDSSKELEVPAKSPVFAMSLGAKELFHTNFLAFLLESGNTELEPMQLAVRNALDFPRVDNALTRCALWREKNSLDLVVVELRAAAGAAADDNPQPTDRVLVLEAKLKSMPDADQLQRYDDKLETEGVWLDYPEDDDTPSWCLRIGGKLKLPKKRRNVNKISSCKTPQRRLLSVDGKCLNGWQGVSWKALQSGMQGALEQIPSSGLQHLLADYTESLGALIPLIERVQQLCDNARQCTLMTYGALRREPLAGPFRKLCINDLLGKPLFDRWLQKHIHPGLERELKAPPKGWKLHRYVHYSNGTPGLGMALLCENFCKAGSDGPVQLELGVQIQDCVFRTYFEASITKKRSRAGWSGLEEFVASNEQLLLGPSWFRKQVRKVDPKGHGGENPAVKDSKGRRTNLLVFDKDRFLFSSVDIDNETVIDVEEEIRTFLHAACELAPQLQRNVQSQECVTTIPT